MRDFVMMFVSRCNERQFNNLLARVNELSYWEVSIRAITFFNTKKEITLMFKTNFLHPFLKERATFRDVWGMHMLLEQNFKDLEFAIRLRVGAGSLTKGFCFCFVHH